MPIFHDFHISRPSCESAADKLEDASFGDPAVMRRPSEESIRTQFLDGPLPDCEMESTSPTQDVLTAMTDANLGISDRVELIERIKRGESPTWVPNRTLEDYFHNHNDPPHRRSPESTRTKSSPLLPAAEIVQTPKSNFPAEDKDLVPASEIERPRSALHAGDFTQQENFSETGERREKPSLDTAFAAAQSESAPFGSSPTTPWFTPGPPSSCNPFQADARFPPFSPRSPCESPVRPSVPSLSSFPSSFILKAPTSPLVQSSTNTDLSFSSRTDPIDISENNAKASRRHTLPPRSFYSLQASPPNQPTTPIPSRHSISMRGGSAFPYQAHQPRRSLSSTINLQTNMAPQTPIFLRSRRTSLSSEFSPLQHAPMVGSYEESILRGRMSTVPSKPLNFVAQIGVLGLGNCKPNLRCPAHVSVPFPAVFYSYGSAGMGRASSVEEGPSPYVGLIDIENALGKPDEGKQERRKRRHLAAAATEIEDPISGNEGSEPSAGITEHCRRRREKRKRRSSSPKAPPGGSYRIPQKGQLQIVIKNPNKTAVKLFLVPYDLKDMEPGMKTFIRQRSYSTGPIMETPIASGSSPGPGISQKSSPMHLKLENAKDRPTLRYLIHLHICCPSRGRYYLYKSIRVVFANRVPDGKEKLINEIQFPEPRYSIYKPSRDSNVGAGGGAGASLVAEKAFRRRSSGFGLQSAGSDLMDGIGNYPLRVGYGGFTPFQQEGASRTIAPVEPIPFNLSPFSQLGPARSATTTAKTGSGAEMDIDNALFAPKERSSPGPFSPYSLSGGDSTAAASVKAVHSHSRELPISSWKSSSTNSSGSGGYDKLNKGDVGYGGNAFVNLASLGTEGGEGLLAKRLRGLDVQRTKSQEEGV
ncbi:hypothetical protein FGG08_005323 [Glutinoglossum americanum]|uniref:Atos-like conserved domain-containing protein n=1 Tax=Glutinoglossum americanum TaxID=1670608 RepID=A0A9P8HYN6_9PEZI|nr:hypothetical protein FGG08_005323 [Glutinoglossum americanum]